MDADPEIDEEDEEVNNVNVLPSFSGGGLPSFSSAGGGGGRAEGSAPSPTLGFSASAGAGVAAGTTPQKAGKKAKRSLSPQISGELDPPAPDRSPPPLDHHIVTCCPAKKEGVHGLHLLCRACPCPAVLKCFGWEQRERIPSEEEAKEEEGARRQEGCRQGAPPPTPAVSRSLTCPRLCGHRLPQGPERL